MFMNFFARPLQAATIGPAQTRADQLAVVEGAYRAVEREFHEACAAVTKYAGTHFDRRFTVVPGVGIVSKVNGWKMDPERFKLETARHRCWERRNLLLEQRASLRKQLGM